MSFAYKDQVRISEHFFRAEMSKIFETMAL